MIVESGHNRKTEYVKITIYEFDTSDVSGCITIKAGIKAVRTM